MRRRRIGDEPAPNRRFGGGAFPNALGVYTANPLAFLVLLRGTLDSV